MPPSARSAPGIPSPKSGPASLVFPSLMTASRRPRNRRSKQTLPGAIRHKSTDYFGAATKRGAVVRRTIGRALVECSPLGLEAVANPGDEAVVGGVAYPEDRIVTDERGTPGRQLQPEADTEIEVVGRGWRPRENQGRKLRRVVDEGWRDGGVAGAVLVRPMKAGHRIKEAKRCLRCILRLGAEGGQNRIDPLAVVSHVDVSGIFVEPVDAGVLIVK